MTGIQDLQTMFGATSEMKKMVSGPAPVMTNTDAVTGSNQSLTGPDRSVVSATAGALVKAANSSDVRSDKVAELKAAIADRSYRVSASDVADKLMDSMLGGK